MRTLLLSALFVSACANAGGSTQLAAPVKAGQAEAIFAGGCFWCMESDFEKLPGVIEAESGYTGGKIEGPTYEMVGAHMTHHLEGVRVVYDPSKVSYQELVHYFFRHVDPTQTDGQFCDRGEQYTTAVFVKDDAERKTALAEKKLAQETLGKTVVTPVRDAAPFWLAEDYHQDYYKKNPGHYLRYRTGCRRDATVRALWGEAKSSH
ncbi:MAG: peptide-methionine (S)-S-oxide reductase MsrA [Myxococcales bacterium]|nr:peptide-methionine (S)-S-oxide reductase MsrA [Myxococcales bacterium]MCB9669044.1 peptide-methionine (S)-S-oxide reductase MsrA [Alphaproteobacteria bacterium]